VPTTPDGPSGGALRRRGLARCERRRDLGLV